MSPPTACRHGAVEVAGAGRCRCSRWRSIDLRATALAGLAVITTVIVALLWEIAHGRSGQPFTLLGAIAGITYLLAMAWLRWRS